MRQHKFVSHSFIRRFPLAKVAEAFSVKPTRTDPKAAMFQSTDGGRGGVFIYSFGAVTFWNCDSTYIADHIRKIEGLESNSNEQAFVSEDFSVEVSTEFPPRVKFNSFVIDELTRERAEVVALTLAQSTTMEVYELQVENIWNTVSQLVEGLKTKGHVPPSPRKFHRLIADVVSARNNVVGVLHLLDRPDLIWNDPTMDAHYADLRTSFDLDDRFRAVQYKLANTQDSLELIIDMARDSRLFLLEAAIVALILIEIVLTLIRW